MKHLTPIDLLFERLSEYKHALKKSVETCEKGKISTITHNLHKINLNKAIIQFENAINKLKR